LFRDNGGPTLYPESNRTSVIADVQALTVYIVFATLLVAFFVVMPGIRKERFTTFTSVVLSLFVGGTTLVGICGCGWHTATAEISSAYRAFSNEKIQGRIGVYIGLDHVNVTLAAMPRYYNQTMDVNFNERFDFERPDQLKEEYRKGLKKGLPFPILTVAEYMSVDAEGFCWGRNYRQAGYYTNFFLWASFAVWLLMNIMLIIVPRYGAYLMSLTGAMMMFSDLIYVWLLPSRELKIPFEGIVLEFELGWCFWLVMTAGGLCMMIGISISVIDLIYPHKFSIVLEMDYGSPFDRHAIIEDSHETRKKESRKNKKQDKEDQDRIGLGGLLRRFSKRDRDRGMDIQRHPGGEDNFGFNMDMDAPKSPWRYPHLMFRTDSRKSKAVSFKQNPAFDPTGMLRRTDSKESNCSSMTSMSHREDLRQTLSVPVSAFHKQFKRTDSNDSNTSSLASFGLSLLSRNNSKKNQLMNLKKPAERTDSDISRGFVLPPSSLAMVSSPPMTSTSRQHSAVEEVMVADHKTLEKKDEVAIVVGSRKNSMTKAVRRNSAEHKRDEASMW